MEYCFLRGFLVVFVIQHLTFEGLATTIQSSTASPQEPEMPPPAEVVPVVAPPSLKEVQQAVQEASEQAEGRGAEEVLKELLERVVEAALGQVEGGGGEVKADEAAVQEAVEEEDAPGAEEGGDESEVEVLEQTAERAVGGEDGGTVGGNNDIVEEQEVVDASENAAEEEVAVVGEGETVEEETTAGVETAEAGREESLDPEISQGTVVDAEAETGGYVTVEEEEEEEEVVGGVEEDSQEQLVASQEKVENETQEVEETPDVEVAEPEQETEVESVPHLEENQEQIWVHGGAEGDVIVPQPGNDGIESTQTVVGESVEGEEEEEEEEENVVKDGKAPEAEDEQGRLPVEGEAAEEAEAEGAEVGGADGGQRHGEGVIKGEPEGGDQEQIAETSRGGGEEEDQEALVISAPVEQSPDIQVPTPGSSLGGVEPGEHTPGDETSSNEIIAPTDPVETRPTLGDAPADAPHTGGEEPGEADEQVEDTAGNKETSELGLEAWKIGAISAAAFLVLETVIIIIYILKCRHKNSAAALQRACEEGCVEPEAATGGDCSDDTLPAGNGDAQQIAALGPCDATTSIQSHTEQNREDRAIAMSNLAPSSAEESANAGPGPGPGPGPDSSSQDLRTSTL